VPIEEHVKRIFLTLGVLTAVCFVVTGSLGLSIGNASSPDPKVQTGISIHMLAGMGTLTFAMLVHAITLTYFMGTGQEDHRHGWSHPLAEDISEPASKL
jgi:hypothetical protein